ncbi:noncanonical pyrimidine nucleotidase, YjjG family [Flavobacteriaceae bacterium R38]|nr:noncanonical pyrimidine nucleotidase, YjjG family [Flavobacteriaceae bacterium R38]
MKEQITDVFFDLDHTLWDFEKNSAITFQNILKECKIDIALNAFLAVYVPLNFSYWKLFREEKISKKELRYMRLRKTFDALSYTINDDQINDLSSKYIEQLSDQSFVFENTNTILEYLRQKYRLHIITNGFEEVQEKKMMNANIHKYFTHVINSEMVGVKKPNPLIFEYALNKAKVKADHAIMIGDNLEADIMGAKGVGMHALHFNSNDDELHEHSIIINNLIEIKEYL